jgi:transposase
MLPAALQFVIAMIACAINERMQRKLDYTQAEVQVLKEILAAITGSRRISFTADQRRRLAVAGKVLSPEERKKCCQLVKPATILGWFRQLAARKYDSSKRQVGRPRKQRDIRKLVVDMALANPGWGYTKIRDALRTGLKIEIGRTTVADILAEEGIEPAPEREKKRTWKQFIKMHWDTLYACDFFSVEALCLFGTVRYMVFFVIEVESRAVEIAGIAVDPGEEWMKQMARNLVDPVDGFLRGAKGRGETESCDSSIAGTRRGIARPSHAVAAAIGISCACLAATGTTGADEVSRAIRVVLTSCRNAMLASTCFASAAVRRSRTPWTADLGANRTDASHSKLADRRRSVTLAIAV